MTGVRCSADVLFGSTRTPSRAGITDSPSTGVERQRVCSRNSCLPDNERALDWLERAYENRESPLMRLGMVWDWLDLHGEPRFQVLLRRMNLPV